MYEIPISVSMYTLGRILFVTQNSTESKLYSARLHCPVDKITFIQKNDAKFVMFMHGVIFLVGYNVGITLIDSLKFLHISLSRITRKTEMNEVLSIPN